MSVRGFVVCWKVLFEFLAASSPERFCIMRLKTFSTSSRILRATIVVVGVAMELNQIRTNNFGGDI